MRRIDGRESRIEEKDGLKRRIDNREGWIEEKEG